MPTNNGLPPLIPRDVLFGNPEKAGAQISPDGRRLAYLAPVDGVLNVWVGETEGENYQSVTHDTDRGIRVYSWAHDDKHLLYLPDRGGDENWRLCKVDLDSGREHDLTPFEGVQVQIIAHRKQHPNDVLIGMNKDDERLHDVYHLDLTSNAIELVEKNPGDVNSWVVDLHLAVRAAVAMTADGGSELRVRDTRDGEWRTAITWAPEDALTSGPLAFAQDGGTLYLTESRDADTSRLVALQLETGETNVIAEDPRYDLGNVVLHPDTRDVQMVAFTRARQEWTVLDRAIANDIALISRLNPGDFDLVDRTHADDKWIIAFTNDAESASYHLYDCRTKQTRFLFYVRPDLANYRLAKMEPIQFLSRDGLVIEGYLTRPPNVDPRDLPTVLLVHGGPWHRDVWGYDPEAQWLANRGYVCLQVNFRGSTGYGKAFVNAGNREWGAKMHDDLVDAVQWVVGQGIADPARVAIYGGSYGGYAALVGATFTPDLFCCAVDIVGPSNLVTFIKTIPPYWSTFLAMLQQRVGDPETEAEFLMSRSPLTYVDRIAIPMLIAQGANDPRVKQSEAEQIVAAMKRKGIPHEYLLFEDEGHGFAKPENRLTFYAAAERFLAQHLGGRFEE
ncbi:MAG: S9 family peptidase [Gemmatimonadales bacterium]